MSESKELTGQDFKEYFNSLSPEHLKLRVMFDTEARNYDYHMAAIEAITCESIDDVGEHIAHIGLHENIHEEMSAVKTAKVFIELQSQLEQKDKQIKELKDLFKKSHEEQIMQIKYEIAIEFKSELEQKDKRVNLLNARLEALEGVKISKRIVGHEMYGVTHKYINISDWEQALAKSEELKSDL